MKIWIIITTSLIPTNYEQRKIEYINGIKTILDTFKDPKYKIVIVENVSQLTKIYKFNTTTFLNQFNIPVLYTKNNSILKQTINYGIPEILDIFDCIKHFNIQDDDFIVKVTGRYFIDKDSPFFKIIDNLENTPYSAVVRFNQYDQPVSLIKSDTCVTGIIGLKCKYVKQIEIPDLNDISISIEMKWAKVINTIEDSEVCCLEKLGLFIKPKMLWDYCYVKI